MSPQPRIAAVDDTASGPAGQGFSELVDQSSLAAELDQRKNLNRRRHPFADYCAQVIKASGVPDAAETRKMASHVCGVVASLPFLPDAETEIDAVDREGNPVYDVDTDGNRVARKTTEFEQQIIKTARDAELLLESNMVWTASALKLARSALELRRKDPDGKKHLAWVNEPLPGERAA